MQPHCGLIVKSLETEVKIRKRGGEANILCAGCGFQRGDRTPLSWVEEGVNYPCPPQLAQGWCFQRGNRASWLPGWRGRQLPLSTTTYTKFMFSEVNLSTSRIGRAFPPCSLFRPWPQLTKCGDIEVVHYRAPTSIQRGLKNIWCSSVSQVRLH